MLNGVSRIVIGLLAAALFAIGSSWMAWFEANSRLENELAVFEDRFVQMAAEHKLALEAAESAQKARDEIHALAKSRFLHLEKILDDYAVSDMPLPAGLRRELQEACSASGIAPGIPAGTDKPADP